MVLGTRVPKYWVLGPSGKVPKQLGPAKTNAVGYGSKTRSPWRSQKRKDIEVSRYAPTFGSMLVLCRCSNPFEMRELCGSESRHSSRRSPNRSYSMCKSSRTKGALGCMRKQFVTLQRMVGHKVACQRSKCLHIMYMQTPKSMLRQHEG